MKRAERLAGVWPAGLRWLGLRCLGAAGVAAGLVASGGSGGSSSHGAPVPTFTVGSGHVYDTAYIVRRVRAHLDTGQNDVAETVKTGGNGNPGTEVTMTSWRYTDPQSGVRYESSAMVSPTGTNIYAQFIVGTPIDHGARWQSINLDPVQHLYAVTSSVESPGPTVADDIRLDGGLATRDATAIVVGQPTITLTMPTQEGGWRVTLYVNSRTYAPVQSFSKAPTLVSRHRAANRIAARR
jgi:hypothetical protein